MLLAVTWLVVVGVAAGRALAAALRLRRADATAKPSWATFTALPKFRPPA